MSGRSAAWIQRSESSITSPREDKKPFALPPTHVRALTDLLSDQDPYHPLALRPLVLARPGVHKEGITGGLAFIKQSSGRF